MTPRSGAPRVDPSPADRRVTNFEEPETRPAFGARGGLRERREAEARADEQQADECAGRTT